MNQTIAEEHVENVYDYNTVYNESLAYFDGDELAATTWMNKYAVKDKKGNFRESSPADMHARMAEAFARIEARYDTQGGDLFAGNLSEYGLSREPLTKEKILDFFNV